VPCSGRKSFSVSEVCLVAVAIDMFQRFKGKG
jgi:hypothetical protein